MTYKQKHEVRSILNNGALQDAYKLFLIEIAVGIISEKTIYVFWTENLIKYVRVLHGIESTVVFDSMIELKNAHVTEQLNRYAKAVQVRPWNICRVITPVDTSRGAPMGRHNVGSIFGKPEKSKVYDKRVVLIDGYDKGGAYWGNGAELRVKFSECLTYINFYRLNNCNNI